MQVNALTASKTYGRLWMLREDPTDRNHTTVEWVKFRLPASNIVVTFRLSCNGPLAGSISLLALQGYISHQKIMHMTPSSILSNAYRVTAMENSRRHGLFQGAYQPDSGSSQTKCSHRRCIQMGLQIGQMRFYLLIQKRLLLFASVWCWTSLWL